MVYREAITSDIDQMHILRISVKENVLSDPALIRHEDYFEYLNNRGKGWVCSSEGKILGFAIADLLDNNIWALFVQPDHEKKGIGKKLHDEMLQWYFSNTEKKIWLTTAPGTRAEQFYLNAGWKVVGKKPNGEIHFEMEFNDWSEKK